MSYGLYGIRRQTPARPDLTQRETNKREKHVFGPHDTGIEHVWANPGNGDNRGTGFAQTHATNPQRNFYFKTDADGTRVLYSYRDTYPIASRFVIGKPRKQRAVYLIRSGSPYSVTTSRHISAARNAVPDKDNRFDVPYVTRTENIGDATYGNAYTRDGKPDNATHKANLADLVSRLTDEIGQFSRARSTYKMTNGHASAIELRNATKKYARVFKLKCPKLPSVPAIDKAKFDKWKTFEDTAAERTKALRERQAREWEAKYADDLARWKNGEDVYLGYGGSGFALLRVRPATTADPSGHTLSAVVETSMRVTVPVSGKLGAARLLRFLQAIKEDGRTYQRNGHTEHIGNFTVESFKPAVLTASPDNPSTPDWILEAGCHRIRWSEIESIAQQVFDAETSETLTGRTEENVQS